MIYYKTKKGDRFDYNPRESKFIKPEIQGMLEKTLKSGIVDIHSTGTKFKTCLVALTNLGFIVLDLNSVDWETYDSMLSWTSSHS